MGGRVEADGLAEYEEGVCFISVSSLGVLPFMVQLME